MKQRGTRKKVSYKDVKIDILDNNDEMSRFRIENNFVFYYPGRLNTSALEWSYYDIVINNRSSHYYEKYGTIVKNGDVVFDIGACEGFFAYHVCDRASKIYCIEPNANMANCLKMTFNGMNNIEVVKKAFNSSSGTVQYSGNQYAEFRQTIVESRNSLSEKVCCVSLDEYAMNKGINKIDYLKIDVEGSERDVIRGARNVIIKHKPKIAIATYHNASDALVLTDEILNIMPSYNYRICGILKSGVFKDEATYNRPRPVMAHFW